VTKFNRKKLIDETIHIPTSLCKSASLPEEITNNPMNMRELHKHRLNTPGLRFDRIDTLIQKFKDSKVLDNIGMKLNPKFAMVKAK
jgi:hypothetical protein